MPHTEVVTITNMLLGWGPYIILAITILAGAIGWAQKRLLSRIDQIIVQVDLLTVDVAVIKSRQPHPGTRRTPNREKVN